MSEIVQKKNLIIQHEELFANTLALKVLEKPKLSVWMILIPIIFVFYFYQYQKFLTGRKMFAEHYLVSRKRALDEAVKVVQTGREPDIGGMAKMSEVPDDIRDKQSKVLSILVEHYVKLLQSDGEVYESLVRSAYQNSSSYLLFLNSLNQAEKDVNRALTPHLQKQHNEISSVVDAIDVQSEILRRESAGKIFP
jgi:hypothetical protein